MEERIRLLYYTGNYFSYIISKLYINVMIAIIIGLWLLHTIGTYLSNVAYIHCILPPIITIIAFLIIRNRAKKCTNINRHVYFEIKHDEIVYHSYFRKIKISTDHIKNITYTPNNTLTINKICAVYDGDNCDGMITLPIPDVANSNIDNNFIIDIEGCDYPTQKKDQYKQILNLINYISNKQFRNLQTTQATSVIPIVVAFIFTSTLLAYIFFICQYLEHYAEPTYNYLDEEIIYNNTKKTTGTINGYNFVDLGLSVVWGTENLGAEEPTDSGKFYIWGNIHDITHTQGAEENRTIKKKKNVGLNICGINKWDPARNQMEGRWRMPRKREIEELLYKCKWYIVTTNKMQYFKIVGPNGNHIIMPTFNCYTAMKKEQQGNHYAHYLSGTFLSTRHNDGGMYCLDIYLGDHGTNRGTINRYLFSGNLAGAIRPVANLKPISFTRFLLDSNIETSGEIK